MSSESSKLNIQAIVLAAGKSSRFKTTTSKLLTSLCGKPLIVHQLEALASHGIPITMVLGYQAEGVLAAAKSVSHADVSGILQHEQKGTGHAVAISVACKLQQALRWLPRVCYGTAPGLTGTQARMQRCRHCADARLLWCLCKPS